MDDDLSRAQHYRALFEQLRRTAEHEPDQKRHKELLDLASQYERLADRLVGQRDPRNFP